MPTQTERALERFEALSDLLKKKRKIDVEYIYAWAFSNWGIRKRTVAQYFSVLKTLGNIEFSPDFKEVKWSGK